jgi:phage terminase large subunit
LSTLRTDVPRAFQPLLASKRYKGAHGGRGSGKSHFFAEQLILKCYASTVRAACIREVQNTIRDSVRQLLIDKIAKFDLGWFFEVLDNEIRAKNGSLIIFKGMQSYNAESIKSLEGFDIAWVEEAQTLSEKSLRMLRPTIRNDGSEIWFSWNPRHDFDPVDEFFRGPFPPHETAATCVEVNWHDNPWFPEVLGKEKDADYAKDPIMAKNVWGGGYEVISIGSYYGAFLVEAEEDKRIGKVPWEPKLPVHTAWDLGIGDPTAIWFCQQTGQEVRIIDYYEASGVGLEHYVKVLKDKRYVYGEHILPHDVEVADLSTGRTRLQFLASLGLYCRALAQETNVDDGISAVRNLLPQCWFDAEKCSDGLKALRQYRAEYDEKLKTLKQRPLHDWTSHAADAFRYLARGLPDQSFSHVKRDRYSRDRKSSGSAWARL